MPTSSSPPQWRIDILSPATFTKVKVPRSGDGGHVSRGPAADKVERLVGECGLAKPLGSDVVCDMYDEPNALLQIGRAHV